MIRGDKERISITIRRVNKIKDIMDRRGTMRRIMINSMIGITIRAIRIMRKIMKRIIRTLIGIMRRNSMIKIMRRIKTNSSISNMKISNMKISNNMIISHMRINNSMRIRDMINSVKINSMRRIMINTVKSSMIRTMRTGNRSILLGTTKKETIDLSTQTSTTPSRTGSHSRATRRVVTTRRAPTSSRRITRVNVILILFIV